MTKWGRNMSDVRYFNMAVIYQFLLLFTHARHRICTNKMPSVICLHDTCTAMCRFYMHFQQKWLFRSYFLCEYRCVFKVPCVIIIVDTSSQYISWPLDDSDDRPVELATFAKTLEQESAARLRATAWQTGNKYHPVMRTGVRVNCHNRTDLWAIKRHCITYTVLVSLQCLSDYYIGKVGKGKKNVYSTVEYLNTFWQPRDLFSRKFCDICIQRVWERERESETERTEYNVEMLVSFKLRFSYFTKFLRSNKPDATETVV